MFAEKTELKLVEDLNENAIVVLGAGEVDEVSGAIVWVPILIGAAKVIGGAAALGAAGYGAYRLGYWANRQ